MAAKKISQRAFQPADSVPKQIKKILKKDKACYVLITCNLPNPEGDMGVEMTYDGDLYLVSYLLEMAQALIDERIYH